ncbi:MAG: hypothetical protein ACPLY9_02775 [Nitrososphaerales archaeon]
MDKLEMIEDTTFILYLSPLLINGLYALYLSFAQNLPPSDVYLGVANNIVILLASVLVVLIALVIEIRISPKDTRIKKIEENVSRMRILAFLFIILSLFSVFVTSGNSLDLYLEGRYAILYPLFLLALSLVLSPSITHFFKFSLIIFEIIPIVLMIASPLLLYILWRMGLSYSIVFSISLLVFIAGVALFLYGSRVEGKSKTASTSS